MCATMLVETVNVSTFTVRASEESTAVSAITQDSDLKEAVGSGGQGSIRCGTGCPECSNRGGGCEERGS